MKVPEEYNFIQTLDMYIKASFVLKQDMHSFIEPVIHFLQHFVYKIENINFKPTNVMLELYNKLTAWTTTYSEAMYSLILFVYCQCCHWEYFLCTNSDFFVYVLICIKLLIYVLFKLIKKETQYINITVMYIKSAVIFYILW